MSNKLTSTVELSDGREVTVKHPKDWSQQRIKLWAMQNASQPYDGRLNDRSDDISKIDLLQAGFWDFATEFIPDPLILGKGLNFIGFGAGLSTEEVMGMGLRESQARKEEFIREFVGLPLEAELDTVDNTVRAFGDPTTLIGIGKTGARTFLGKAAGTTGQALEAGATTYAATAAAEQARGMTGVPAIDDIISQTLGMAGGTATGVALAPVRATLGAPMRAGERAFTEGVRASKDPGSVESVRAKTNAVSEYLAEKQVEANLNSIAGSRSPEDIGVAVDKIVELKEFAPGLKLEGVMGALSDNAAVQDWTRKIAQRDPSFIERLDKENAENIKILEKRLEDMTGVAGKVKDDALYTIAEKVYIKKKDQLDTRLEKAETAFEKEMANLTARLSSESLDVVGQKVNKVAAERESFLRSQADSLYEVASIAGRGVNLPERHVKGLSTLAASIKQRDPFGVDSGVRKELLKRWSPDKDGNVPEVPVNDIVSLKKAINTDLNNQYKAKAKGDFEAGQRIEQLGSLKATVEAVIKSLKRSPGTKDFASSLKKADGFYYEKIGLPLRAEGMAYINQTTFNKDAATHLTSDTQKARDYINFVGEADGSAVLRHAMRLKAETAVLDANGQISTQKLRNFMANRTNQELISMAKMGKEFSNLEKSAKTLINTRKSHQKAHEAEVERVSNGFFKALTQKNADGAVRSMLTNPKLRKDLMGEINSLSKRNREVVLSGVRNAYISNGMLNSNVPLKKYLTDNRAATVDFFGEKYVSDLNKFGEIFDILKSMDANVSRALGADPAFDALQQRVGINAAELVGLARNQILSTQRKVINATSKIFLEKGRQRYYKLSADMLKDPEVLNKLANPPQETIAKTKKIREALELGRDAGVEAFKGTVIPYYQQVLLDTGILARDVGPRKPEDAIGSVGITPAIRSGVAVENVERQENFQQFNPN